MKKEKTDMHKLKVKRPFFLSFLCIIAFTYTILFSLLFLAGMLYSTGISVVFDKYMQLYDLSRFNFFLFSLGGFVIFFTSFIGVLLIWKLHWFGFYIYTAASIALITFEFFVIGPYLPDLIVYIALILLFLIAFPHKRFKRKAGKEPHNISTDNLSI